MVADVGGGGFGDGCDYPGDGAAVADGCLYQFVFVGGVDADVDGGDCGCDVVAVVVVDGGCGGDGVAAVPTSESLVVRLPFQLLLQQSHLFPAQLPCDPMNGNSHLDRSVDVGAPTDLSLAKQLNPRLGLYCCYHYYCISDAYKPNYSSSSSYSPPRVSC